MVVWILVQGDIAITCDRARFSGHGAFVLGGAGAAPAAAQAELEFKLPNQAELGNSESLGLDDAGTCFKLTVKVKVNLSQVSYRHQGRSTVAIHSARLRL